MVFVIVAFILAIAYFYLGTLLESAAREGIRFVSANLATHGIEIQDPDFSGVSIRFPPAFSVKEFSAHMVVTQHNVFQIDRNFFLTIDSITISLESLLRRTFAVTISGAIINLQPEYGASYKTSRNENETDRMEILRLQVPFRMNFLNRREALSETQSLIRDFANFAKYGVTERQMRLSGASAFVVREKPVGGKLLLVPREKGYKLVMDPNDFRVVATVLGELLTEAEFDVYCNNPLRMPRMLRIRNYASDKARSEHKKDVRVPEEAYKHILWGYLLFIAYGEKFSAEVTDAHEINPAGRSELAVRTYLAEERGEEPEQAAMKVKAKTEAEKNMDLTNNYIGREYARKGFAETSLLARTMSDPRVIRSATELENDEKAPILEAR